MNRCRDATVLCINKSDVSRGLLRNVPKGRAIVAWHEVIVGQPSRLALGVFILGDRSHIKRIKLDSERSKSSTLDLSPNPGEVAAEK
jgi:hypothetical protein